ncbi:MAG: hypothetical protein IT196_05445 [Acidimicrobiales bacterium]|nr:hypothetical protein [Acidimicrobiales bacterium]
MAVERANRAGVPASVILKVAVGVARRPRLWPAALFQLRATAAPRWWRRPPFLPLPPRDYLAFRGQTMYGGAGVLPAADAARTSEEVLRWLAWTAVEHRAMRRAD